MTAMAKSIDAVASSDLATSSASSSRVVGRVACAHTLALGQRAAPLQPFARLGAQRVDDRVVRPNDLSCREHVRGERLARRVLRAKVLANGLRRVDEDLRRDAVEEFLHPPAKGRVVHDVHVEIARGMRAPADDGSRRDDSQRRDFREYECDGGLQRGLVAIGQRRPLAFGQSIGRGGDAGSRHERRRHIVGVSMMCAFGVPGNMIHGEPSLAGFSLNPDDAAVAPGTYTTNTGRAPGTVFVDASYVPSNN